MSLCFESHTYDWRPNYPFVVTAKRYWDPSSARLDGYTCILAHGTGFHGEQWEPTLTHLFVLSKGSHAFPIREAWSIDCPNHGDAAIINEEALLQGGYELVFSWAEYVHALYLFLTQNKDIQFADRKIIAIGHSMGAVSLFHTHANFRALTQTYPYPPKFAQLMLCEPMVAPTDISRDDPMLKVAHTLVTATESRRDIWTSMEDASKKLKSRKAFAAWDDEVFKIYLKHGFRHLPTGTYPNQEGVTLKCPKGQEAACYRDSVSSRRIYDFLPALCARLPVHVIWGAIDDSLVPEVKDRVTDAKSGRKMASVTRVQGAGHLVVQIAPKGLAAAIFSAVAKTTNPQGRL